ncbi:MAG: flagellar hook-basal body complex protein [Clostridiales bacterium]|nr:flagellar hook-basal body complex protein [Clostridiales bacterium]
MMRSLFSGVSGLKSHQTAMDVIGNNVANVNTTGYKSSRAIFQDIYSQTISTATPPGATTGGINPKQVGLGVSISAIGMNMTEGSTQSTSYPLDFAISGEGFFVVDTGEGLRYTRSGALTLDANGCLVTGNGDYVMAVHEDSDGDPDTSLIENGDSVANFKRIQLLGSVAGGQYVDYAVDVNGVITATFIDNDPAEDPEVRRIGRLVLATFNNAAGLEKTGASMYTSSPNSGAPVYHFANDGGAGALQAGSLEMSNVDLASELTSMIITQRGFQANSRVITTSDTMLEELINLKR